MTKLKIFSNYHTTPDLENAINTFASDAKIQLINVSMFVSGEVYKYGAAVVYRICD